MFSFNFYRNQNTKVLDCFGVKTLQKDKILELQSQGLDTNQIANEMNRLGLKSQRGRPYTGKLVWVTIKKWKEREERMIAESQSISSNQ